MSNLENKPEKDMPELEKMPFLRRLGTRFLRLMQIIGSLKIALPLMILSAAVCGWATFVERDFGTAAASQLIYGTGWFRILCFLLGINLLGTMLARLPWKMKHIPFLLAHAGVLVLLVGCWITHRDALEGEMAIFEGTTVSEAVQSHRWSLNAEILSAADAAQNIEKKTIKIPFSGGVFDRAAYTAAGWKEYVTGPALDRLKRERGFWSGFSRLALRGHYALARWAAVASGKGQNGVLYDKDGLKIERIDYLCPGQFPEDPKAEPVPAPFMKDRANEFYALAKFKVTLDGKESEIWLRTIPEQTPNAEMLARTVAGENRTCHLALENAKFDSGLAIHVKRFDAVYEPGSTTPSSFSSLVDAVPESADGSADEAAARRDVLIRMNRPGLFFAPAVNRKFWVYQSSFRGPYYPGSPEFESVVKGKLLDGEDVPREKIEQTVLTLNSDPGRPWKYAGSVLIVFGTLLLIVRKQKKERLADRLAEENKGLEQQVSPVSVYTINVYTMPRLGFVLLAIGVVLAVTLGSMKARGVFYSGRTGADRAAWRNLPVWSGGRAMPLMTFARMTVRDICGTDAPILTPDKELLDRLKNGELSVLPDWEKFLAEEKPKSSEEEEKLKNWYEEEKKSENQQAETIYQRAEALFPKFKPRRFTAVELIFAWSAEPELWRYIPILAAGGDDLTPLIDGEKAEKQAKDKEKIRFMTPYEAEISQKLAQRVDQIQQNKTARYTVKDQAVSEGKLDRIAATVERNLSLWRSVTFSPKTGGSPMVGYYLEPLLYADDGGMSGAMTGGMKQAPLEELEFSVRRLKSLRTNPENADLPAPFDDPAFELNQTLPVGEPPKSTEVLRLLRRIHLLLRASAQSPYEMNARLFASLLRDLDQTLSVMTEHRSAVFASSDYSIPYRSELLRTTRLLGEIRQKTARAATALSTLGSYRMTPLADKKRLMPDETGKGGSMRPGAALAIAESGSIDIFPFDAAFPLGEGASPWASLATVTGTTGDLNRLFFGEQASKAENIAALWTKTVEQYQAQNPEFRDTLDQFCAAVTENRDSTAPGKFRLETVYDRLDPFYYLWFLAVLSVCFSMLTAWSQKAVRYNAHRLFAAIAACFLGGSAIFAGTGELLRGIISGWAPVTNMFETVVLLALMVLLVTIGYAFYPVLCRKEGAKIRTGAITLGAVAASAVGLLAYYNTAEFNPAIRPIAAVLRSNFWLAVHVTAIMASYALGVIAWGIALFMTGKRAIGLRRKNTAADTEDRLTMPLALLLRWTVLLLTAGTILGAYWADCSWGRFWSWDPKEVWALVTLLVYLVVLHRRYLAGWRNGKLATGGLLGATAIIMTWYGLSFVFGAGGRHSYAAGEAAKTMILYLLIAGNLALALIGFLLGRREKS